MREKVVNFFMIKIKNNNKELSDVKLEEIKYGLTSIYTIITKTTVILCLSLLLNIFYEFLTFLLFYIVLRSVGYGSHAKSNLACWFISTLLLLGLPYLFSNVAISSVFKIVIWSICFINYLIFCPADTENRPIISKKRKLKFKLSIIVLSIIYLFIIFKFESIANLVLASMCLEALLTNPLGYILMGQKVRFRLNDYMFKLN